MGPVFKLYRKDLKQFFSDRTAVILSFLVPAVMAIIFGFSFGGSMAGNLEELRIDLDVVDLDDSEISRRLVKSIEDNETLIPHIVTEDEAYEHVKGGKRSAAIIIPKDFSEKIQNAENVEIKRIYDPADQMENGVIEGLLNEVLFTSDLSEYVIPQMIERRLREDGESDAVINIAMTYIDRYFVQNNDDQQATEESDSDGETNETESSTDNVYDDYPIRIVGEQIVGQNVDTTVAHVQAIVSAMVMFLLFGVSHGARSLLKEKNAGTLKRLLVTPLTIEGILTAKLLMLMTSGLLQIYFMLLVGWLVFKLEIWTFPLQLFLIALGSSLMASGLGVMLTGAGKTEEQVDTLSTLVILALSAVGGAMVPKFIMPAFMRQISYLSPVGWAVDGFHNVFWRQQGFLGMLPQFGVLIGFALVFLIIGSILVRRQLKEG